MPIRTTQQREGGFTLLEMMVVVMIIGLLAAMVVPNLMSNKGKADQKKTVADIVALESALDMFSLDHDRYPTEDEGLQALLSGGDRLAAGYIKRLPRDPWGQEYLYRNPGMHGTVDLYTLGQDKKDGGEGLAADIGNWNVAEF